MPRLFENFAGLFTVHDMSNLAQYGTYNSTPTIEWKCMFPNCSFVSFVSVSVLGEPFLLGTKDEVTVLNLFS